jgi:NitT/TauT family transport system permease protein
MTGAAAAVGVPIPPAPSRRARTARTARYYGPAVAVAIGALILWELLVQLFEVRVRILPAPSAIGAALVDNWSGAVRWPIFPSAMNTLYEAVLGLAIGTTVGLVVAFGVARWITVRDALLPIAIAINAIPIIAFAPIMNNWFGVLNPLSKAAIAAMLVFFPVMINVTRGLASVDPAALELMRSYAASERTIMLKLRIPNALPFFLTGLKVGTTLSLIGAIVGEYFGGSSSVLGRIVVQSASSLRFDVTWAAILLGATAGIVFYLAVVAIERVLIPWHPSVRGEEPA